MHGTTASAVVSITRQVVVCHLEHTSTMLADTLALGTGGTLLTYGKKFGDAQLGASYTVVGLTPSAAANLSIKHQREKSGTVRTLIDLSTNVPVAGSTTGAYTTRRVYLNIVRGVNDTAADMKADLTRLKTIVDSTALQDQILAEQV